MNAYVLSLEKIDRTQVAIAGGKGAHLGELTRIEGVRVPPGFCVTTAAFRRALAQSPTLGTMPDDVAAAITSALERFGAHTAYAVRSSATAEDSPTSSFAGLHDSYLNIVGRDAILEHVRRCWASLFTERAVRYRERNLIDDDTVQMAVVVQQMVQPYASGVLFTADPITGNRRVSTVDAVFGLGDALVSGLVNADAYKVRDAAVIEKTQRQERPVLTDAQVVRLAQLGRRIEAHFGAPQDIEWCLSDDDFFIVQSRPITTLYPIPKATDDEYHVYVSVGHGQMMTDAMKPLGISLWQLTTPAPALEAGARLFVDVTAGLASPARRAGMLEVFGKGDPLIRDALETVIERGLIRTIPDAAPAGPPRHTAPSSIETGAAIVQDLIGRTQASIAALKREIEPLTGIALLDFIKADIAELKRVLFDPQSGQAIMAGMEATWWLNEKLEAWLGEKNAADTLAQSVPDNITSEMGLALLDVADVIRAHPEVVAYLEQVTSDDFLDHLSNVTGGVEARDAIVAWLDKYGMRCAGEIDVTRPRWIERPTTLLPLILSNVRNFQPGAAGQRFQQGLHEARRKEDELLQRLRALPDGEQKAGEAKRMIDRLRTFVGYREYPKYGMVTRYFIYKQALLGEAERLVRADVLREPEDIFFLTFQELHDVVRTQRVDQQLIVAASRYDIVVSDRAVLDNYAYMVHQVGPHAAYEPLVRYWMTTYDALFKVPIIAPPSFDGTRDTSAVFQREVDELIGELVEQFEVTCHFLDPDDRDGWTDAVISVTGLAQTPVQMDIFSS